MADSFVALATALGLGALVGLQRERTEDSLAGIRTFPLITLSGTLAAQIAAGQGSALLVAAGLLGLVALMVIADYARIRTADPGVGITTEIAAVVMYLVGVLLARGDTAVAVVATGAVTVLLQWKQPLHRFADRLADAEARAIGQVALIALVVLPVLPDRTFGPYDVLNPYRIWLMVVLIGGISLGSYVAYRLVGARAGTLLGGVLGGLISSTATTASYGRRAANAPDIAALAAAVIMVASTVVFVRILVEIGAVAPALLPQVAPPLVAMTVANAAICAVALWRIRSQRAEIPEQESPVELATALIFGALYGAILFAVAAAKEHMGDTGIYLVAAVSGLTDVDAITLSVSNLAEAGRLEPLQAWRAVLLAALSNLVFKGAIAGVLGGMPLLKRLAPLFAVSLAIGVAILVMWPTAAA